MLRNKHEFVRETRREPTLSVKVEAKFWCPAKLKDDESELNYTIDFITNKLQFISWWISIRRIN